MTPSEAIQKVKVGDRITISTPQGQERIGRAVMVRPDGDDHIVLNMGGKHGTPGIATRWNIIKVPRLKFDVS